MSHQIETRCIHGETHKYRADSRAISFPIYQTAFFAYPEPRWSGPCCNWSKR